jgi:hypothetical protein
MERNDWILLTAFFAPILTFGALFIVWKFADDSTAASWVQAFGAIAAIAVAIYFARADRADRRRGEVRRAYALLQSLTGSIFLLDIELQRVQRVIDQYQMLPPDSANWDSWFKNGKIEIPSPLKDAMPLMQASEDEMVGRFRTVAMLAETFNAYMIKFSTLNKIQVQNTWYQLYPQIAGQLSLLRTTVKSITG